MTYFWVGMVIGMVWMWNRRPSPRKQAEAEPEFVEHYYEEHP